MELFLDVLGESLVDTAKMLPFLFLAYLLIEYIETRHGERIEALLAGGGRWGAIPGAVLGCVPQCGFSAIASNFYSSRVITLGTLMAVYLATSDEAIPLLVSMPAYWDKLAVLMVIKVVYAIALGSLAESRSSLAPAAPSPRRPRAWVVRGSRPSAPSPPAISVIPGVRRKTDRLRWAKNRSASCPRP